MLDAFRIINKMTDCKSPADCIPDPEYDLDCFAVGRLLEVLVVNVTDVA